MQKFIFYAFTMLCTSCAVSIKTVNVDVLIPSPEKLNVKSGDRIMLVANYRPQNRIVQGKVSAFVDDSLLVSKAAESFKGYYQGLGLTGQSFVSTKHRLITNNEPELLTPDDIKSLGVLEKPSYVVEISLYRTLISKEFPTVYKATSATLWHVYNGSTGEIIREIIDKDSIIYDQNQRISRLELDSIIASDMAYKMGEKMGANILPFWEEQQRLLLIVNDPKFMQVEQLINDFKWKEVASLMQDFVTSAEKDYRYAATFNLALACEMMGDLKLAQKWLEKCKTINNSYVLKLYEADLQKRMLNEARLKQ